MYTRQDEAVKNYQHRLIGILSAVSLYRPVSQSVVSTDPSSLSSYLDKHITKLNLFRSDGEPLYQKESTARTNATALSDFQVDTIVGGKVRYTFERLLGEGTYGMVCKAKVKYWGNLGSNRIFPR